MMLVVLAVALFARPVHAAFSSCHNECTCLKNFVICSEIKSLKSLSLPVNTSTIVLDSLRLKTIPADVFGKLGALSVLELQGCAIESLDEGAFRNLGNMEAITIAKCNIGRISGKAFSNLNAITRLTFSENVIRSVSQDAFYNITNVTEITFQSNNFTNMAQHAFHHIKAVKFFHFYLNTIAGTVKAGGFEEMKDLDTVNIYLNNIKFIECRTLDNLIVSGKKVHIYSNTFKCHCKLTWMLSQASMRSYLSSNLCATKRDSKQIVLSTVTTADLHCSSATPTYKQQGCPQGKLGISTTTIRLSSLKHRITTQMRNRPTGTKVSTVAVKSETNISRYDVHVSSMSTRTEQAAKTTHIDKKSLFTSTSKSLTTMSNKNTTTLSMLKNTISEPTAQIIKSLTPDSTRPPELSTEMPITTSTKEINLPMTLLTSTVLIPKPTSGMTFLPIPSTEQLNKLRNTQTHNPPVNVTCCVTLKKRAKLSKTINSLKDHKSRKFDRKTKWTVNHFQGQSLSGSVSDVWRDVRGILQLLLHLTFFVVI